MNNIRFQIPSKVDIGFSKSNYLSTLIKDMQFERVLLVVDSNLQKFGLLNNVISSLDEENITENLRELLEKQA